MIEDAEPIRLEQVSKRFGSFRVLDEVSIAVPRGQATVILGRSGTGKSVMLKHIVGLLALDAGRVIVQGADLTGLSPSSMAVVRRQVGFLFQNAALFDSMTVAENIAFPLRQQSLDTTERARMVAEVLNLVELPGIEAKKPAELSGGMRKRVGLARAIVHRPEIILYDEPTTGLDPVVSDSIDQLMLRVREHFRATTVVVTHDMRTARRLGRRILYLREGRIYLDATPDIFFSSPDPVVSKFVNGQADQKEVEFS